LNIVPLSEELADVFRLSYAERLKKNKYRARQIDIKIQNGGENAALKIQQEAYVGAKQKKSLLILISPKSGPGKAKEIYEYEVAPLFTAAGCKTTVKITTHRNHGAEIARDLDATAYDAIVCCSGDGIPHEVINGFAKRADAKKVLNEMPIAQIPCGSGNSMACSLNGSPSPSLAALGIIKGIPMKADLMYLSQGDNVHLTFLSQTYGLIADADLGTENLRFLGGQRFAVGAVMRALSAAKYPCEVDIKYAHKDVENVKNHYDIAAKKVENPLEGEVIDEDNQTTGLPKPKYGTVNDPTPQDWVHLKKDELSIFYVGNMPYVSADALFFPGALPNDGFMDMIILDSSVGRIKCLDILLQVEEGKHVHSDRLEYSKIEAYRVVPKIRKGYLSVDGESFPIEPFQVEILPGAGCFLSSTGKYFVVDF
jgi:sphingosine kinase